MKDLILKHHFQINVNGINLMCRPLVSIHQDTIYSTKFTHSFRRKQRRGLLGWLHRNKAKTKTGKAFLINLKHLELMLKHYNMKRWAKLSPDRVHIGLCDFRRWPKPVIPSEKKELKYWNRFEDRNYYFSHSGTKFSKKKFLIMFQNLIFFRGHVKVWPLF